LALKPVTWEEGYGETLHTYDAKVLGYKYTPEDILHTAEQIYADSTISD
jgi:hypothetical protein